MYTKVDFSNAEISDKDDFSAISDHAQRHNDDISEGALGWPAHWAKFTVSLAPSPDKVLITEGEYYNGSKIFKLSEPLELSLQTYKPLVATDERWLALILRGEEKTENALRLVETAEQPLEQGSVLVEQELPKYEKRLVNVHVQAGDIAPFPAIKPTVSETDCAIAFVLIKTTGVEDIVANDDDRVKSVFEIEGRLVQVEAAINNLNSATNTIQTDLAGVAAEVEKAPSPQVISQLVRDAAVTRQVLDLDEDARDYVWDDGLIDDFWDLAHASGHFRVDEGMRFPYEQVEDNIMRLLDPANPDVQIFADNTVIPAYDEVVQFEIPVGASIENLSNAVHTIRTARQVTQTHVRVRYGPVVEVCENGVGWQHINATNRGQAQAILQAMDHKVGKMFQINGQTFQTLGVRGHPSHEFIRVRRYIEDRITTVYDVYDTKEVGLNGAIYYQQFPSSQLSISLGFDLYLKRIGSSGDIQLCLCEVQKSGTPDFDSIIKTVTVPHSELKVGWVRFGYSPAVLEPGKSYAWFTVTTGNHEIAKTTGNVFPSGTAGKSVDGVWAQGSIDHDYSCRHITAKFKNNRYVVPLEAVTLAGGMTELDLVYQCGEPGTSNMIIEVKPQGTTEWLPLDGREDNALNTKPPLCEMRLVFVGTPDIAPVLRLDVNSRIRVSRLDTAMTAVSDEITFANASDTFKVITFVDAFDDALHTASAELLVNGNPVLPDAITMTPDRYKPERQKIVATFSGIAPVTDKVRAVLKATTTSDKEVPFFQDIQVNSF